MNIIKTMVSISNYLDEQGMDKEADVVDSIMKKVAAIDDDNDIEDYVDDSKILDELKDEAMEACKFRGHDMGEWKDHGVEGSWNHGSISECKVCGKDVQVLTKPAPNQIDIGGPAVALGCED